MTPFYALRDGFGQRYKWDIELIIILRIISE